MIHVIIHWRLFVARPHPAGRPVPRRTLRRSALVGGLCAALLGFAALPPAQASAASAGSVSVLTPTAADATALAQAYAEGRHIPRSAVGAVRSGSTHLAEVADGGTEWALASFQPSASAGGRLAVEFQDGAAKGLFQKAAGGDWRLLPAPTAVACAAAVPAAVKAALGLSTSAVGCDASTARPTSAAKASAAAGQSLGSQISSIALGQVGLATTPAETSFDGVDCDPFSTLDAAFSPNADGCGPDATHRVENQNEEWCSDFAKWAWAQAGVTADMNTLNAGANSFYAWALQQGQSPVADSGTPAPGDAVLFYPPGTITASSFADHVGVITAVNPDGTVNIVDGDFLGSTGITVEYDQDIDLTSWSSAIWNTGEQWMLIPPPGAAQQPAPTAAILAPSTAAAGRTVDFGAVAAEPQGSITQYYWTFDDGRNNNVTGQHVSHVFQRAGLYTVTMSATSNLGTVTTKTWNIGVSAPSSTVSSVPNNSVWYTTEPMMQYEFAPESGGGLAVDSWDGANWLQQTEPGPLANGSGLSGLTYSDADAGYATVPHAYYRTSAGTLGETYLGADGWTSASLPGAPAARSAISALAADPTAGPGAALNVTPSVFFFDGSGSLDASSESSGGWSTAALGALPATASPGSLATAVSGAPLADEYAFYLGTGGRLTAASDVAGHWIGLAVPNKLGVLTGTQLSAATTSDGVEVFFVDAAGDLAVASSTIPGIWQVRQLPGTVADGSTLAATNTLSAAGTGRTRSSTWPPTARPPSPRGTARPGRPRRCPAPRTRSRASARTSCPASPSSCSTPKPVDSPWTVRPRPVRRGPRARCRARRRRTPAPFCSTPRHPPTRRPRWPPRPTPGWRRVRSPRTSTRPGAPPSAAIIW